MPFSSELQGQDFWSLRYEGQQQEDVSAVRAQDFTNAVLDTAEGEVRAERAHYAPVRSTIFSDPAVNTALQHTAPLNFTFESDNMRSWGGTNGGKWSKTRRFPKRPRDKLSAGQSAMQTNPSLDAIYSVDRGIKYQSKCSMMGATLANRARRFQPKRRKPGDTSSFVGPGSYSLKNMWRLPQPGVGGSATFESSVARRLQDGRRRASRPGLLDNGVDRGEGEGAMVGRREPRLPRRYALVEDTTVANKSQHDGDGWQRLEHTNANNMAASASTTASATRDRVVLQPSPATWEDAPMRSTISRSTGRSFPRSHRDSQWMGTGGCSADTAANRSRGANVGAGARTTQGSQPFINFLSSVSAPKLKVGESRSRSLKT